jgi:hypothetical protein
MKINDPSAQYKFYSSWKGKVRASIQDKITDEVTQRNYRWKTTGSKYLKKEEC